MDKLKDPACKLYLLRQHIKTMREGQKLSPAAMLWIAEELEVLLRRESCRKS